MKILTKKEKMRMVRLAAVLEKLHGIAHDKSIPEEEAVHAAAELGRSMLTHFELIIAALKK